MHSLQGDGRAYAARHDVRYVAVRRNPSQGGGGASHRLRSVLKRQPLPGQHSLLQGSAISQSADSIVERRRPIGIDIFCSHRSSAVLVGGYLGTDSAVDKLTLGVRL
jgi:hypothetical protein